MDPIYFKAENGDGVVMPVNHKGHLEKIGAKRLLNHRWQVL